MIAPATPARATSRPAAGTVVPAFAAMGLLGVALVLVPSLIRDVQRSFGLDDAGMALAYFLNGVLYVGGSLALGALSGRVPRRLLLAAGPGLIVAGFTGMALAPGWSAFLVAFMAVGAGAGLVDAGMNALVIDLYPGRPAVLNRLHLSFAVGGLGVPLLVGSAAAAGLPWQALVLALAAVGLPIALALAVRRDLPPVHPAVVPAVAGEAAAPVAGRGRLAGGRLPLAVLALAIAAYVAAELGLSAWLVRFLDAAPIQVATLGLSLYWAGLAAGRLVASVVADRLPAVPFTAASAALLGGAVLVGVAVPDVPVRIAAFAVAGFGAGPVFPMIMAIGASVVPGRASLVSSVLISAAMIGTVVYPAVMGVVSEAAGLVLAMTGAGAFGFVTAGAVLIAGRLARARAAAPAATGA